MVTNRRSVELSGPDFYPTPKWGTLALLENLKFSGEILEPCCGDGAMSEILIEAGYTVKSSDIADRGYGKVRDFLSVTETQDNIVTNPPFNIAAELINHALKITAGKACFLLRTAFLESRRRYEMFFQPQPPCTVLVFSERLSMYPKGATVKGGGTTSYSWFIWDMKSETKETHIKWIKPGLKPGGRKHREIHR